MRAVVGAGCAVWSARCNTDQQVAGAPEVPTDYRLRHPITLQEADTRSKCSSAPIAAGSTPTQRAEVLAFGAGLET